MSFCGLVDADDSAMSSRGYLSLRWRFCRRGWQSRDKKIVLGTFAEVDDPHERIVILHSLISGRLLMSFVGQVLLFDKYGGLASMAGTKAWSG
ncbi:hypothetical protein E4U55_005310, partial [Claviceps digitariae]